jgi:outer membrane protein assembly factor BamB
MTESLDRTGPRHSVWWRSAVLVSFGLCGCGGSGPAPALSGEAKVHRTLALAAGEENREGEDWPIFLGPRGTGISGETGLADKWPKDGPPLVWEKKVGTGYSAPAVLGHRLVLHHRIGKDEIVECMRADNGQQIWQYTSPSNFKDPYGYNNGPRCSPLLTAERCYTFGAEGKLICLDLKRGKQIWLRDTKRDFNVPNGFFGVGCTPILEGKLLIVLVGGQPNSGVVAFNAETGKTVWQSVGKQTWDGVATSDGRIYKWTGDEMLVSYSSPLAATIHGKRHILCLTRQGLVSLDPKDGTENFKYWFRSRVYESVNAARPLVVDDKIFLSAAYRVGSVLLRVNKDGKGVEELWRNRRNMLTHWSTAIHVDGYVYGFSGRHENEGELRCLDIKTGKVVWKTTGFDGDLSGFQQDPTTGKFKNVRSGEFVPWPDYGRGSKIKVGDKFIVLGERGTLALVKINPKKFEEISRTSFKQIHKPAWTAPVLSRKLLYLRCENALICLDVGQKKAAETK